MPSIRLVRNPKRVIVQWVDIRTHTHTHIFILNTICFLISVRNVMAGQGGTLVMSSPMGPKIAGSNPTQTDRF